MYSSQNKILLWLSLVIFFSSAIMAKPLKQGPTLLAAIPTQCIALHQGRKCFAKIKINWQTKIPDNYCLYQQGIIIKCWKKSQQAQLTLDFESNESISFVLKDQANHVMAQTTVIVGWLHKTKAKKRRWRLF
ncbi:MAG: DUF3019 domain-containing protein [Gammaproteobacteria bacterium]|nr:DUF3019 domain-containing protein [Gammaproteobacteria bacterium]